MSQGIAVIFLHLGWHCLFGVPILEEARSWYANNGKHLEPETQHLLESLDEGKAEIKCHHIYRESVSRIGEARKPGSSVASW